MTTASPHGRALHHPEVRVAVADVAVELDEAARVEELLDALAGEQLAALALALDGALDRRVERLVAQPLELGELVARRGVLGLGHQRSPPQGEHDAVPALSANVEIAARSLG